MAVTVEILEEKGLERISNGNGLLSSQVSISTGCIKRKEVFQVLDGLDLPVVAGQGNRQWGEVCLVQKLGPKTVSLYAREKGMNTSVIVASSAVNGIVNPSSIFLNCSISHGYWHPRSDSATRAEVQHSWLSLLRFAPTLIDCPQTV
jgi:hypothetical protein